MSMITYDKQVMASLWGPSCILLSGKAGAGKDTVADYLSREYGYEKLSFASPMKKMLEALLEYQLVNPSQIKKYLNDRAAKEAECYYLGSVSPRRAMQTLGSEWGREHLGDSFWAYVGLERALSEIGKGFRVVFTDARFPEEVGIFPSAISSTKWIKVANPRVKPVEEHMSETGLDHMEGYDLLKNEGSLEDLYENVDTLMEKYCVTS